MQLKGVERKISSLIFDLLGISCFFLVTPDMDDHYFEEARGHDLWTKTIDNYF